jgi:GntR family transcriptional repressor for pyruvate dehydrogenase complex
MSRLHHHLLRVMIGDIVNGAPPEGGQLPREADLAADFGVSRTVARECLRGLEDRGLVTVRHGRGTWVLPRERWDVFDRDVVAALLDADDGAQVLTEYLECRRILEIEAAGLAATRATAPDLVTLSDAFARMTSAAQRACANAAAEDLYHEADIAFHRALIAATGNRALGNMTEPIHCALATARRALARPQLRVARSLPEHRRILSAIAEGDAAEARAAMAAHLHTVETYLGEYADRGSTPERHGEPPEVARGT